VQPITDDPGLARATAEQLARRREGREPAGRVVALPAAPRRPLRVLGPLQGLVLDT